MLRTTRLTAFALLSLLLPSACDQVKSHDPAPAPVADSPLEDDIHAVPPHKTPRSVMIAKLAHAQAVLEGIALENLPQVEKNARHLELLSQRTDWLVHRTIEYNALSMDFRRIMEDMANHAKKRNIHAVTLDYMQMTMTCVKCHSHMRREGLVELNDQNPLETLAGSINP